MHKRAVIYARVSTARQAEDELPLEGQIQRCEAKARELGAEVVRRFVDEGISGTTDARKEFQAAITYCELMSVDYLVTWSTSRFARNRIDAGLYKRRLAKVGTEIAYVSVNIDRNSDGGWVTESVLEIFDEFYSRQVAADTIRSMVKNATDGHFNGGRVPFGYQVVPAEDNPKRKRLAINPEEAEIVRRIFEMRASGIGGKTIATNLRDQWIKNRALAWNKTTVSALLRNQTVIGCTVFGRKTRTTGRRNSKDQWIVVNSHEPIISDDLWNAVQTMMDEQTNPYSGSPKSTHLFTGLLYCAENGSSMQIETAKSGRYAYYGCRDSQKHGIGPRRRIPARQFDQWLLGQILDQIITHEFMAGIVLEIRSSLGDWGNKQKQREKAAMAAIKSAIQRNEKLLEVFETLGKDAPAMMRERFLENSKTIERNQAELDSIRIEKAPAFDLGEEDAEALAEVIRGVLLDSESPKKVRHFLSTFIDRIMVAEDSVRIEYRPEALVELTETGSSVPNVLNWLPGRAKLGTRTLFKRLPERFRRAA